MADTEMTEFVLDRVYGAPPQAVWRTWTEPTLLARWYKPDPTCQTSVVRHELRPGGVMLYQMRFGERPPHCERWEFTIIEPTRRLQWKQMLADTDGNVIGNSRMPDWPRVMLTTIDLMQQGAGTLQRLTWQPHEATEAEIMCFRNASAHLDKGWVGGLGNQGDLLKELVGA